MQRAATGLATVCLRLLGARLRPPGRAARRHRQQRRRRAVRRRASLAGRGARVHRRPARPRPRRTRPGWPRSAGPVAACSPRDAGGARAVARADLVLDGMLGIGGRGGLRPDAAALARAAAEGAGITVAVDVPSGVDADTGAVDGDAFPAMHTVTFGAVKLGLVVGEGRAHAGQVHLVDIGLGPHLPAPTACSSPTPTSPPRLDAAVGRRRQVLAGRGRRPRRLGDLPRRRRALHRRRAAHPPGPGPLRRDGGRRRPGRVAGGDRHRRAARATPAACRPGWSDPAWAPTTTRAQRAGRGAGHRPAGGRRRRRADPARRSEPDLVRRPERARPCSPRTTASSPGSGRPVGERPGRARPGALAADLGCIVLLKGDATVVADAGRDGVRQRHRHAVAGHGGHRRRARRASPARCWPTGPAGGRGRRGRRPPARPHRAAGRASAAAASPATWSAGCPEAVGRVRGIGAGRAWETRRRDDDSGSRPAPRWSSTSTRSPPTPRCCASGSAGPLMAVVKADGYGHGLVPAARAVLAGGADALGVAVARRGAGAARRRRHRAGARLAARPGHRLRRRAAPPTSRSSVNAGWGLDEVVAAARATGRHRPGAPRRRHRALPRGRHPGGLAGAGRRGGPRAGRRRRRRGRAVEPPGLRRRAHPPDDRRPGAGLRGGGRRRAGRRADRRPAAPGQLRGHDRAAGDLVRHGPPGHRPVRAGPAGRRPARSTACARR